MMNKSSIRVDLSNFFNDARQCALILIDDSWSNINDVQDHIQKLFRLANISLLTQDDCFLSPKESVKVLESVESLKAFILNELCSSEEELGEPSTLLCRAGEKNGKKRKNRSSETEVEFSSSTPNCPKRSKSTNNSEQRTLHTAEILKVDRPSRTSTRNKSKTQITVIEDNDNNVDLTESIKQTSLSKSNSSRESYREPRGKLQSFRAALSSNNHIIYKDVEVEPEKAEKQQPAAETTKCRVSVAQPQVEFRCKLAETDPTVPRIFQLPRDGEVVKILEDITIPAPSCSMMGVATTPHKNNDSIVEPMEAQAANDGGSEEAEVPENLKSIPSATTPPAIDAATNEEHDDQTASETFSKVAEQSLLETDSEDDVMVLDDTTLDESSPDEIMSDMLENAAPLTDLPNIGETIIFKLTRVKGAPPESPKTDYIAGTCSYINRRTKSMTISVIATGSVPRNILRGYMSNLDDSSDSTIILRVGFLELIEARVVVSTVD